MRTGAADSHPPAGTVFILLGWSHDSQWKAGSGVMVTDAGLRLQALGGGSARSESPFMWAETEHKSNAKLLFYWCRLKKRHVIIQLPVKHKATVCLENYAWDLTLCSSGSQAVEWGRHEPNFPESHHFGCFHTRFCFFEIEHEEFRLVILCAYISTFYLFCFLVNYASMPPKTLSHHAHIFLWEKGSSPVYSQTTTQTTSGLDLKTDLPIWFDSESHDLILSNIHLVSYV